MKPAKKRYYGWIIVLSCVILSASSTGLLSFFNALFVSLVTQSLHISRTAFMMTGTFSTVSTMLVMPFVGAFFKRYSMKSLLLLGGIMGSGAHFCYSFSPSVTGFYIGSIIAGFSSCFFGTVPMAILLANWFNEKRGFVTGIAFTGSGIVAALFSPILSTIITQYGWRTGYRVIGISILVLMIPTSLFLVKEDPETMGLKAYGSAPSFPNHPKTESGFSRRQVFSTLPFWVFSVAVFLLGMITMATQQQLVAYWQDTGSSARYAATMYSVVMFTGMLSKILLGSVYDKTGVRFASIISCSIAAAAMLSLLFFTNGKSVVIPAILFGMTTSVQIIVSTILTSKFFGKKDYGSIYGIITTILYLGISVGIPLSALLFDVSGTYKTTWILFAILAVIALICILIADVLSQKEYQKVLNVPRE